MRLKDLWKGKAKRCSMIMFVFQMHGLDRGNLKSGDIGDHIGVDLRAPRDVQLFWGAHPSSA